MVTQAQRIETLEGRVDGFGGIATRLEERVHALEHRETSQAGSSTDHTVVIETLQEELVTLRQAMEDMNSRVSVLTCLVALSGNVGDGNGGHAMVTVNETPRVRVPEPRAYGGARDAKELENFLFDMEQYFRAVKAEDDQKVSMATMYLTGDAKLWWRTKSDEIERGVCTIETWEVLKRELKAMFFPENVEYNARRALRDLKHTGTIRDYVKAFSALMLDIKDMS
jgi:hypothetical protein